MTDEPFALTVSAHIRGPHGGSLSVDERVELPAGDFAAISRTLARFHGFAERLRAELVDEGQGDAGAAAASVYGATARAFNGKDDVAAAAGPTDLDLAYLAYGRYVSTVPSSPCGHPLPMDFDRLPLTDRRAWAAAAAAVAAAVRP